jgi:hypothetical protein
LSWRCRTPSIKWTGAVALLIALLGTARAGRPDAGIATAEIEDSPEGDGAAGARRPGEALRGQARFEAALRLYTAGPKPDAAGAAAAAAALEQLARELPQDDIAPEALFEAAQLYDEQLGRPEQAQRLYADLVHRHPSSRLVRRAESRLSQLGQGLRTGADALTRFQHLVRSTKEDSPERIAQLQALLAERPDFALADHALYLLGSAQLRAGKPALATATFAALESRFPTSEWTAYGHKAQADTLTAKGLCGPARLHLRALLLHHGPVWASAAHEGLQQCDELEHRRWWARLAIGYLSFLLLALGLRARRTLWPPPFEIYYYTPVAGFLVLVSLGVKSGMYLSPVLLLAGLGAGFNWLAAAAARRAAADKPLGAARRALQVGSGLVWRVLAVVAICYLVIDTQGLYDLLIETVRNGADE